ncbi:methyl-accepting chemotaxis protein [Saliphagus infecundisoli]|uniref:Methyl-accepting chemotaxis protein n=1 Tax=Saliphagus infecundisoli TaxID=1849069 RepID=A0ABD5QLS0_9EURY|nr:methyl-accepting chemotaxis protein [Saliphagus infecundisoli]
MPIGQEPDEIDAESPAEHDVAVALGFESLDADRDDQDDELPSRAEMWELLQQQGRTINRLEARVDELQHEQTRAERNRKEIASRLNDVDDSIEEADDTLEQTKEIAKAANANANQAKSIAETGGTAAEREDSEDLPGSVEPSSSPLDFLANCRQHRVKTHLVDRGTPRKNRFRALLLMKRWDEFATKRTNGSGIFWTRDNVKEALTAILGKRPHAQTLKRVWKEMVGLGSSDVDVIDRRVSATQDSKEIIAMDRETAEGLLDTRYHHLELLTVDGKVSDGVTPVVTQSDAAEV